MLVKVFASDSNRMQHYSVSHILLSRFRVGPPSPSSKIVQHEEGKIFASLFGKVPLFTTKSPYRMSHTGWHPDRQTAPPSHCIDVNGVFPGLWKRCVLDCWQQFREAPWYLTTCNSHGISGHNPRTTMGGRGVFFS